MGITAYEREIGIDKYDKVKRKIKPLKGTQIILNEINGDSKNIQNKDKNLVENGDIEKCNAIESCDKICDIKTSDSSDNINDAPNKETIAQLDGASDCDIDEATPAKKRKLDPNDEIKDKNIEENNDEKTSENDEKSMEIEEKLSENLEKSAESNKNTPAITENPAETTKNALNESSDDVVMLSSDEEYVQPPSPKYKVPEEEVCYFY